jgi:hypothetical protein
VRRDLCVYTNPSFLTIAASRSRFLRCGLVVPARAFVGILRGEVARAF